MTRGPCTTPPRRPPTNHGDTPGRAGPQRTPPRGKARQLAKYLRGERPGCACLKEVFWQLRG